MSILDRIFGAPNIEKMVETGNVKGLIKCLDHTDEKVRQAAAAAFKRLVNPNCVDALIDCLEYEDEDQGDADYVQELAAVALRNFNDLRPVARLIELLQYGMSLGTQAARTLGCLGDRSAVAPLTALLRDTTPNSPYHFLPIIEALGELRDPEAVDALIARLDDNEVEIEVRIEAAIALGKIGDKRALQPLIKALQRNTSARAEGFGVAGAFAVSLGQIDDSSAIPVLLKAVKAAADHISKYPNTAQAEIDLRFMKKAANAVHDLSHTQCLDPVISAAQRTSEYETFSYKGKVAAKDLKQTLKKCFSILSSGE